MFSKVPPYYISYIAQVLDDMGISKQQWLEACNASPKVLSEESHWLSLEQYLALIAKAVEMSMFPDIGLRVGNKLGIGSHGMLGFALLNCRDLEQAIDIVHRYINTRTPLLTTEIHLGEEGVAMQLKPSFPMHDARRAFLETVTVTFCNLFSVLTTPQGELSVIKAVSFDYAAPRYSLQYSDYFPVECQFDAPVCQIVLNHRMLKYHFSQSDEMTLNNLINQFEQQLRALQVDDDREGKYREANHVSNDAVSSRQHSLVKKVRQVIENEHHRLPGLDEVAKVLFLTPRTLHRRLQQENSSYRTLLAEVKKQQAIKYLHYSQMTVQQIAWSLGYDDVANFRRAFKSWTQLTPNEYRTQFIKKNH